MQSSTWNLSRVVWKLSLPIIFVEATETFDHVIDTLFLARVGVTELGSIAVADSVMLLFLLVPLALVDGVQILTARRLGQRQPDAVSAVFNQGLLLVLLVSVACMAGLKLFSPVVANWIVESDAVGQAIHGYLQIDAYSIPLVGVTFACSALLTSLGKTGALVPATIILVVTDLVLNYLFIFGEFGCPALGMRGAAVGSIGAELATAAFLTLYVWRRIGVGKYRFFRFGRLDHRITRLLGRISAPIAGQGLLKDLRWIIFFLIIERVSTSALAIANIVFSCYLVFLIPTEGFSETACSMVSRFVGRNRTNRIGDVLRSTTAGALLATVPFIILALFVPEWLVAAFSPAAELLEQSNASLRVVALAMLIAIPAQMWFTAVVGTGDTAAALGIEFVISLVMLGLTWFAAIHFGWPITAVWMAVPIACLVCLSISFGWMKSGFWRRLQI
jgi:MATE family multidrug resistance protein